MAGLLNVARCRPFTSTHAPAKHAPPARCRHYCRAVVAESQQTEEERVTAARMAVTRRIKQLGSTGRYREAIRELAGLSKLGVQPDTQAGTALVSACCRDMAVAQTVFDELFGGSAALLQPDEVTFCVLLRGYGGLDPPDWAKIDATLSSMRVQHRLEPSSASYNTLLDICVRTNDTDRGLDVLDRMLEDGVQPDAMTPFIVERRKALRSYLRKCFSDDQDDG